MIERLKKTERLQQQKYFKIPEEKKHSSMPLQLMEKKDNLKQREKVLKRKQSADIRNYKIHHNGK